ncbi:MAG: AbrB/MazE/SpoVT family DNA-binding domain-containing protein [Nitriliruptor sp.]|uniref:AbrB/MazE/SpoVT family DNA-binding domain-containing protein n=1 Tax=Nitriliruptor sp. TaxID=2448056 RepID=UPI00349FEF33
MSTEFHLMMQRRGVLTLPADLRKRHHLDEPGAQMRVVEREDGVIELHPQLPVSADQVWFWSARWQRMEREADDDIAHGRVGEFDDVDDFLADLDA